MTQGTLNHYEMVTKLKGFRTRREQIGATIGAAEFLEKRLNRLTFLRPSDEVLLNHKVSSAKYQKLLYLNDLTSTVPRDNEFNHLLNYADTARSVQMSETYIGLIRYLTRKLKKIDQDELGRLLKHVRNVILLTGEHDLLEKIYEFDNTLLKSFNFPELIKASFPDHISQLIPNTKSGNNLAYDKQTDKSYLQKNLTKELSKFNQQQRHGLKLNRARTNNDVKDYLACFNDILYFYKLSPLADVALTGDNILSSLRFSLVDIPEPLHSDFVTVIMSCFNAESTVEYAVESLLIQSHQKFELLVCDDQSTDRTLDILLRLAKKDKRIKVFQSNKNQGTYNIRNSLIPYANGSFITFQDSDDIAHPARLSEQLSHLKNNELLVSSSRWIRITPKGDCVFFADGQIMRFCVVSTMVRREVFNHVPKFRSSLVAADTEFHENCLMLLGDDAIGILEKPLIFGLWGDGSLTKMKDLNAEHNGYVAPRRRSYSETAAKQRVLTAKIITDSEVQEELKKQNIYREFAGVKEISRGSVK